MKLTKDIKFQLEDILEGRRTQAQTAAELRIGTNTLWRWLSKYKKYGIVGLEHGLKYRPSNNRRTNSDKDKIINLCRDKYYDCGPTLASEHLLASERLRVHPETLRRWMHSAGIMNKRRKRKPYRKRRARMVRFGEMLQIDGSFHDWFGSGKKACLMNLIDDATNVNICRLDREESVESACLLLWEWCRRYGVPRSIYSDRRNMYDPKTETQHFFTAMCERLGIRLILANSPQAKGRVERSNRTHQERLIPWLRLRGIGTIEEANLALSKYLAGHNKRFKIEPEAVEDGHKILDKGSKLDDYCYIENPRKISNDWVVSYNGRKYQLMPQSLYCPIKATVSVRETLAGLITFLYRNHPIDYIPF